MIKTPLATDIKVSLQQALFELLPDLPPAYVGNSQYWPGRRLLIVNVGQGAIYAALKLRTQSIQDKINHRWPGAVETLQIKLRA